MREKMTSVTMLDALPGDVRGRNFDMMTTLRGGMRRVGAELTSGRLGGGEAANADWQSASGKGSLGRLALACPRVISFAPSCNHVCSIGAPKTMASVTVRNLPEETHRALRARAAAHGRSTEAEIRAILESAVRPEERVKLGSLLAEIGREVGSVDLEIERDKTEGAPLDLE